MTVGKSSGNVGRDDSKFKCSIVDSIPFLVFRKISFFLNVGLAKWLCLICVRWSWNAGSSGLWVDV